jgi:putative membrane protein
MLQKKISIGLTALAVSAAFALPSYAAAPAATGTLGKEDQKIVADMAIANMAEVNAGKMALAKTQNPQVKTFAQQMVDDHTKALGEVQALAQSKGVTLPGDVDAPHKAMAAKLDKLSGAAFDKAYMADAGVSDHTKVHAKLKGFETKAKDADVKALAAKMLPTVDQHLQMAKEAKVAKAK